MRLLTPSRTSTSLGRRRALQFMGSSALLGLTHKSLAAIGAVGRSAGAVSGIPSVLPPSTYRGITDTNVYVEPSSAPPWGAAGSTYTDPTFNTEMVRVTDANTYAGKVNHPWYPNTGSAEERRFSADSSRLLVVGDGGDEVVYDVNYDPLSVTQRTVGGSYSLVYASGSNSMEACQFSATDADEVYGIDGSANVRVYNIISEATSIVWTTSSLSAQGSFGDLSVALNGRIFIRLGPQDTATLCAGYDPATSTQWVLDVNAGTINGASIPLYVNGTASTWTAFALHNARAGPDGRYVMLTPNGATVGANHNVTVVWDVDGGTVSVLTKDAAGHNAAAYGYLVNNDYLSGIDPYYSLQMLIRSVATESGMGNPSNLNTNPGPEGYDTYSSWQNGQPFRMVPVIWSTVEDANNPYAPPITNPYQREVCAIATDGSQVTYRLFHHLSWWNNNFYDGVHATVSPNGLLVSFGSNMMNSLGSLSGAYRDDVFIAKLVPG